MHISAKADYAVRAAVHLASVSEGPTTADSIAAAQGISLKFLEAILGTLRSAGLVRSQRGAHGGYWLSQPADSITVADVLRAVDGPLASVRGQRPEDVVYSGTAERLPQVWIAARGRRARGARGGHAGRRRDRRDAGRGERADRTGRRVAQRRGRSPQVMPRTSLACGQEN